MLEPNSRRTYLSELRPPEGYALDRAVATTFSLDLLSLLMAPLSMVLFESPDKEEALKDPTAVLEALRRVSGKFAIFCQQGRIAVPKNDNVLFGCLEKTVVEVKPKDPRGVFHAKTWLMRFVANGVPAVYRFLCLSKNLTFDRSWDTVLTLEGELKDRKVAFASNNPLGDFFEALPELAASKVSEEVKNNVALVANEVRRAEFEWPEEFDGYEFLPLGNLGKKKKLDWGRPSRTLIVSPFLDKEPTHRLAESGTNNVLVSRQESFDELPDELIKAIEQNSQLYVMDTAAEVPEEMGEEETSETSGLTDFSGLHAKLVIFEEGWNAAVLSGSANATRAAWSGENVEFVTRLVGKKSRVGIDSFLGKDDQQHSFHSLLRPYKRVEMPKDASLSKKLEEMLDGARRAVSSARMRARITQDSESGYTINLTSSGPFSFGADSVSGVCFPISLRASSGHDVAPLLKGDALLFPNLSSIGLSSFFAFQIEARLEGEKAAIAFVLNLPVEGMPADREKHILTSVVSDKSRFVRYLLFLLSEGFDGREPGWVPEPPLKEEGDPGLEHLFSGFQPLEEMIRAYSRHPERLDCITRLVEDLKQSEEGRLVLPEGFDQIWEAFAAVRKGKEEVKR
jgi:hypothetical protein